MSQQRQGCQLTLTLLIDPELADFQGHFAGYPLLPGVTQIGWAEAFGRRYLGAGDAFAGMEAVKFQQPILPGDTVVLTLDWAAETSKLYFRYQSSQVGAGEPVNHASGRILFCPSTGMENQE